MPGPAKWWRDFAPYWEFLEDRHLGVFQTDALLDSIESPVLVIGAGQGLVVEHLQRKGYRVDGIDLESQMAAWALMRKGISLLQANAAALPLASESYQTVIIATGVIDYLVERHEIASIVTEARRVLQTSGMLIVGFYQLESTLERIYEKLGILTEDDYYLGRLFRLYREAERNPMRCAPLIAKWIGKPRPRAALYWLRIGLFRPRALRRENRQLEKVVTAVRNDGLDPAALFRSAPKIVPYRRRPQIESLLREAGLDHFQLESGSDCIAALHRKLSIGSGGGNEVFPSERGLSELCKLMSEFRSPRGNSSFPERTTIDWMVRTNNLRKRYRASKTDAVDALSLEIKRGQVFGILGPNGAGKTTTLKMLCGLLRPSAGRIEFSGGVAAKRIKSSIGYVPQELAIYSKLSGLDNLKFFGRLYGIGPRAMRDRLSEILNIVGLEDRSRDLVATYSSGMKRRLNLAAGLVHNPSILLLDEPTVGIDPQSRNRIFEAIEKLRARGVTILYTTHYMEEASRICNEIAIMDRGTVLLSGPPQELVSRYAASKLIFEARSAPDSMVDAVKAVSGIDRVEAREDLLIVSARLAGDELEVIAKIREIADEQGTAIKLRSVSEASLEDLFLDLTGRKLRDYTEGEAGR